MNSRGNFGTEDEQCRQSKLVAQFLASMQQAAAAYSMGLIRHGSEAHRIEARAPLYAKPPAAEDGAVTRTSAPVVFQRAGALYLNKVSEGAVNNPCYFAMVLEHTSTDLHHWAEAVVDAPSIP